MLRCGRSSIMVYPRACGGTDNSARWSIRRYGLSPRVRGNLHGRSICGGGRGSIPERAGEPVPLAGESGQQGVYPRACGGTGAPSVWAIIQTGLSPRVRGNRGQVASVSFILGSIPARAGEPRAAWPLRKRRGVYPRACGGNPAGRRRPGVLPRSIPARAGEPSP